MRLKNVGSKKRAFGCEQGFWFLMIWNPVLTFFFPSLYITVQGTEGGRRKRERDDTLDLPEQCENTDNPLRCPVKLYEFYLSKWYVWLGWVKGFWEIMWGCLGTKVWGLVQGFPTFFDPRPPMSRYCRFGDPQALIFTMIMMIILRLGFLLVVFYDDFSFPYWKENYFYSFFCLGDPLLKALRPPSDLNEMV